MIAGDLFRNDTFPDFELLGGAAGLGNHITSVSVIDAPDVDRWMRGGEFLIGSGYIFRDDPDAFIPFITHTAERHVAAIGIKLDRFHHSLQDRLVDTADRAKIPLVQIPLHYRWTDINETVYRYLNTETQNADRSALPHFDLLTVGVDKKRLLSACAAAIDRRVIATSTFLELNHTFSPNGEIEGAEFLSERIRSAPIRQKTMPSRGRIVSRIEFRDNPPEWTVVYNSIQGHPLTLRVCLKHGENEPSFLQERVIIRAFSLLQAMLLENENLQQNNSINLERFFEGLCLDIYSDPKMIRENMKKFGVKMPKAARVLIAVSPDPSFDNFSSWTPPKAIMSYGLGQFWTGLIPLQEDEIPDEVTRHIKPWKEDGIICALGEPARAATEISRSYQEASKTIRWIRNSGLLPDVYMHEELCLYGFLDSIARLPESEDVWKRYWEPMILREHSGTKQTFSYVKLAEQLIQADFNARLCSQQMFIHYNTIRNHIEKLEQTLSVNISDPNHRLALTLAYHINKSRGK